MFHLFANIFTNFIRNESDIEVLLPFGGEGWSERIYYTNRFKAWFMTASAQTKYFNERRRVEKESKYDNFTCILPFIKNNQLKQNEHRWNKNK